MSSVQQSIIICTFRSSARGTPLRQGTVVTLRVSMFACLWVQVMAVHYQNPLLYDNFPDPGVMKVGNRYYAFATNGAGGNVQAAGSRDLVRTLHHASEPFQRRCRTHGGREPTHRGLRPESA